ncbi:hypothetical protein [Cytophaga aurantiaca]|uniref:hypothetical protein n=1 Tax=Cytophaga aurantiaca TaxID=29530 RepID=UPI000382A2B4|nr:hypothetical protein [Cytophaga aurantiaca]
MNRLDYIITLSKGILEAPEENIEELLNYFGAIFELKEIQKPGAVSLAAGLDDGTEVCFADWAKQLRTEKIKKCVVRSVAQESDKLPEHILAAFAGTQEYLFEVLTEKSTHCYVIKTFYSPSYAITTELFGELVDVQTNSEAHWELVANLITESNELNGRKAVAKSEARAYLNSKEGKGEFNFLATKLSEEMQIECTVAGTPFLLPGHLKNLFYQSDFSFFGDDNNREIAFLYALKECSAEQLIQLVHAQPSVAAVWSACEADMQEWPLPDVPVSKATELEAFIQKQTTEQLSLTGLVNVVCGAIRRLSEENHVRPTIPESLKDVFGPDKTEYDKALARGNSKDRWYLKSNETPWEVSFFEPLTITTLLESKGNVEVVKKEFSQALSEIEQFAKKIQSPFEEAFRFANYFLIETVPEGNFDAAHLEVISKDLTTKGFSERSLEVLKNNFLYLEEWYKLNYDRETILGLFAVKNANQFGGMGSWNDQYVEEDPETYEKVSAETFSAMKKYFVVLLSK